MKHLSLLLLTFLSCLFYSQFDLARYVVGRPSADFVKIDLNNDGFLDPYKGVSAVSFPKHVSTN